jgi:hypothetical protein
MLGAMGGLLGVANPPFESVDSWMVVDSRRW